MLLIQDIEIEVLDNSLTHEEVRTMIADALLTFRSELIKVTKVSPHY